MAAPTFSPLDERQVACKHYVDCFAMPPVAETNIRVKVKCSTSRIGSLLFIFVLLNS